MLACLLEGPGRVVMEEVPVPKLGQGDVLVRLMASGICGTDLEKVQGALGLEGILGHEVSGAVEEVGEQVTTVRRGDRVVAHHHVPCYNCHYCLQGDYTMCDMFKRTNFDPCGLADFLRVPEFNVTRGALIPLPSSLNFEEGALIEPTACCIRAIRRARVKPRDNVLVLGLGPTGLTQVQLLRCMTSGKIVGTDVVEARLSMGRKMGADETIDPRSEDVAGMVSKITGAGADIAIVATGNPKALAQALTSVRKGGRILLFGAPAQSASLNLDVSLLFSHQVSIIPSYSCVEAEMLDALEYVAQKTLDLASLITDRFQLKDAAKALEFAGSSRTAIKTMILS